MDTNFKYQANHDTFGPENTNKMLCNTEGSEINA